MIIFMVIYFMVIVKKCSVMLDTGTFLIVFIFHYKVVRQVKERGLLHNGKKKQDRCVFSNRTFDFRSDGNDFKRNPKGYQAGS